MSVLTASIHHHPGSLSWLIKARKINEKHADRGKKE